MLSQLCVGCADGLSVFVVVVDGKRASGSEAAG